MSQIPGDKKDNTKTQTAGPWLTEALIVGLGNPGAKYAQTRHNIGFMVLEAFAKKVGLSFKRSLKVQGHVATGRVGETKVHLLLPTTYMNLSGQAVRALASLYKIPPQHILVVVDDVYTTFASIRLRARGSTGGHNGLKSLDACLQTQEYPRLRMGVGHKIGAEAGPPLGRLEEFVLSPFTPEEKVTLPQFVENGCSVVSKWLTEGCDPASQLAGILRT